MLALNHRSLSFASKLLRRAFSTQPDKLPQELKVDEKDIFSEDKLA